ncbi:MAG: 6-phosphogluconolactonase [Anaerolineae bacterium]
MADLTVFPDATQLAHGAAEHVIGLAQQAIAANGRFNIALSGGSTPRGLYTLLAMQYASAIDWTRVNFYWGDERTVPPDHPDSDYGMAAAALLQPLNLPSANIFRMQGEDDPDRAAHEYENLLVQNLGEPPRFDLILLGLGEDGHTASLFPHTMALYEPARWCVANWVEQLQTWRITLTSRAINAASNVTFLVAGENKAERLRQVIEGEYKPDDLPSQLIKPEHGALRWFVDAAAASLLQRV